jgi:hypothetical protein
MLFAAVHASETGMTVEVQGVGRQVTVPPYQRRGSPASAGAAGLPRRRHSPGNLCHLRNRLHLHRRATALTNGTPHIVSTFTADRRLMEPPIHVVTIS